MNVPAVRQWQQRSTVTVHTALLGLLIAQAAAAAPVDNIRLSRVAERTTVEIELGCAMRYLDHAVSESGVELRVRLELGSDCANALRGRPTALYRPAGSRMAKLSRVEFDAVSHDQASVVLRFEQPVSIELDPLANPYLLTVIVEPGKTTTGGAAAVQATDGPEASQTPGVRRPRGSGPARLVRRADSTPGGKFVLRLRDLDSVDEIDADTLRRIRDHDLYTYEISLGGRRWLELRMGFFDTEDQALFQLELIRPRFPDAWVTIASPEEQAIASQRRVTDISARRERPEAAAAAAPPGRATAMPEDRAQALLAEGKTAMRRSDYDRSTKIFTRLLEQPGEEYRREARELLGVARQKNGQLAHAKVEFEAYLDEFPDGPESERVRQRLAALTPTIVAPLAPAHQTTREADWQFRGGVSQFYLRGVNLARDDEADELTQSALLSQADFALHRRGTRVDVAARASASFLYELEDAGAENQGRVSFAYVDVIDQRTDLHARLGRQTLYRRGVLGRFDGASVSYALRPQLSVNLNAGFPVDSPRYVSTSDRYFYGGSIELRNLRNVLDVSVFANLQTVDGIWDRQAVGADAQFRTDRLNVVGLLDYDASYNVINNAMVAGSWRMSDRLTLTGRYQGGASPFLTTRNAIIGQPVNTVAALFETYSEGQIRRLARNRTAEARFGSGGVSFRLSERWHVDADTYYTEYGSTVASGDVPAFPATGPQFDYRVRVLGSSVFRRADSLQVGYRHRRTRTADADTLIIDLRYPAGDGLRINPRIAVTRQTGTSGTATDVQGWTVDPVLRIVYRGRNRYRIEFEAGGRWSDRELAPPSLSALNPTGSIETSAYYLQIGYWLEFGR